MIRRLTAFFVALLIGLLGCLGLPRFTVSVQAAEIDPDIIRYLEVTEPVPIALDEAGNTRLFSGEELSQGKKLFTESCLSCHIGGATLPFPTVSLSLAALQGATPPRDNISNLVAYFRYPVTYDGSSETYWCREIPESWMSQEEVEQLAAFLLRTAEKVPGWGTTSPSL